MVRGEKRTRQKFMTAVVKLVIFNRREVGSRRPKRKCDRKLNRKYRDEGEDVMSNNEARKERRQQRAVREREAATAAERQRFEKYHCVRMKHYSLLCVEYVRDSR